MLDLVAFAQLVGEGGEIEAEDPLLQRLRQLAERHRDGLLRAVAHDAERYRSARRQCTGPDGKKTSYDYWPDGQAKSVTDPLTNTTFFAYDAAGRQSQVADALNRRNTFLHDAVGRVFATIFPDNTASTNVFNLNGQRIGTASIDPSSGDPRNLQFSFPGRVLRPGSNGVTFEFQLRAAGSLAGSGLTESRDDTLTGSLVLPRFPSHSTDLRTLPYPFFFQGSPTSQST